MTTAIIKQMRYNLSMSKRSLDKLSDEALLTRIADRDEAAFEAFCQRFLKWAYRFDLRILQDHHDAEDAVQEKFLRIWRKSDTYEPEPGSKVTNYLLKIDKNICLDMLRRSYRHREVSVSEGPGTAYFADSDVLDYLEYCHFLSEPDVRGPEDTIASAELMEQIYDFTHKQFSQRQFLIFWGFIAGMSYKELAATYGTLPGSVRGYVARSFASIRRSFGSVRSDHE